jgi:drug/metabolite transporter (DMT)-like permease
VNPGYLLVALAASSWGTWPLILRGAESLGPITPAVESVVLMIVTLLVTGPIATRDRIRARASLREWLGVAWLGVGDAANVLLFFAAYRTTTVAIAVLTHYLAPIFVAVAAPLALRERIGARAAAAVAISLAGLVLLLRPWGSGLGGADAKGAALGAASAAFYASNVLVNKRINRVFSGSEMMFFHAVVAVPLLAALVPPGEWARTDPRALAAVAAGAIGPGALGGLLFTWGLKRIPASHASTLTLLEPLVAVVSAGVVFGEKLGVLALFGGALILAGAAAVVRDAPRPESQTHHPE